MTDDPIEGQEIPMLNQMLSKVWPLAKEGDGPSVDRVLKIIEMRRKVYQDRAEKAEEWRGI